MPSGPKKRKAAKKKMDSLAVSTITQQGNDGSERETASPMSPDLGDRSDGKGGGGGGADGLNANSEQVQVLQVPLVSESGGAVVPVGVIERVETANDVVVDISGPEFLLPTEVIAEETSESSVPCADVPAATGVLHVPTAVGKEPDGRIDDVRVEKVEHSRALQPPSQEQENKVEALGSGEYPSKEIEQNPEGSRLQQSPSDERDQQKIVSFSDRTYSKQPAESRLHHPQKENRDVGTEVIFPCQAAQKTSWLSCCGLFEAFTNSNR